MSQSQLNLSMRGIGVIAVLLVRDPLGFPAHSQSLDQQATCAAQAKKAFQEYSAEYKGSVAKEGVSNLNSDYQSHYNTKINRCLILTDTIRILWENI